jgi:cation:H+ antiporter
MLASSAAVIAGLALLIWSADRFVVGASAIATNLGVSTLVIGLTIVGFGTSAPELLISGFSAWQGNTGLAIGNALGSNIANIALILGITALVAPLTVASRTLRREMPLLIGSMLLAVVLLWDNRLGFYDGILLTAALLAVMFWIVHQALHAREGDPLRAEFETEIRQNISLRRAALLLLVGMAVLLASSRLLVWGAVNIATELGVSDLVIGLTIVAIGTSLPELAASVMSTLKQEPDIALGNVIGSNIFNTLGVLGLPGLIHPGSTPQEVMVRDLPFLLVLTLALFLMAYGWGGRPGRINRLEGSVLLASFAIYQWILVSQA